MERLKAASVGRGLRGDLLAEELEGFLARAADLFVHPRRPGLHLLVHPVTAALAVDDADAFADRVEDQVGLLGDQGTFERKEVGGVGEDGGELIVAEGFDRFVDRGHLDDVAADSKCIDGGGVGLGLAGQHQDFIALLVQASRSWR